MPLVTSGVEKGNLRELALARMGQLGSKCRDVRTREAGIQDIHHQASQGQLCHSHKQELSMRYLGKDLIAVSELGLVNTVLIAEQVHTALQMSSMGI